MRFNFLNSDFQDYVAKLLENKEINEIDIREEIIYPLLKRLGYSAGSENKIVREKQLKYPYVSIGSKKKEVKIRPDYILEIKNKPVWVLEIKSPQLDINDPRYISQTYTYAIHPEVQAQYYALCNGKEFLLFHVSNIKPIQKFSLKEVEYYWDFLYDKLSPSSFWRNSPFLPFKKDYGLHLKMLGCSNNLNLFFYETPIDHISKIDKSNFSFSKNIRQDNTTYCASFDFDFDTFLLLKGKIPDDLFKDLIQNNNTPLTYQLSDMVVYLSFKCVMGDKIEENMNELYLPMKIISFI